VEPRLSTPMMVKALNKPRIGASHCKESDEGIVGGNPEGRNVRRDVVNERYLACQGRQELYTQWWQTRCA
jgi:hypothetical protein